MTRMLADFSYLHRPRSCFNLSRVFDVLSGIYYLFDCTDSIGLLRNVIMNSIFQGQI